MSISCLEFRNAYLVDPNQKSSELTCHQSSCNHCDKWLEKQRASEALLLEALEVEVPESLENKILWNRNFMAAKRVQRLIKASFAIAASMILFLGGYQLYQVDSSPVKLAHSVVQHIEKDTHALYANTFINEAKIMSVLNKVNISLDKSAFKAITHASICVINGQETAHIVIATDNGPVTLLLIPNHQAENDEESLSTAQGFKGYLRKVNGGSIAVVAPTLEQAAPFSNQVASLIRM